MIDYKIGEYYKGPHDGTFIRVEKLVHTSNNYKSDIFLIMFFNSDGSEDVPTKWERYVMNDWYDIHMPAYNSPLYQAINGSLEAQNSPSKPSKEKT